MPNINRSFYFKNYKCELLGELRVRAAYEQRANASSVRTTRELRARTHPRTTRRPPLILPEATGYWYWAM